MTVGADPAPGRTLPRWHTAAAIVGGLVAGWGARRLASDWSARDLVLLAAGAALIAWAFRADRSPPASVGPGRADEAVRSTRNPQAPRE